MITRPIQLIKLSQLIRTSINSLRPSFSTSIENQHKIIESKIISEKLSSWERSIEKRLQNLDVNIDLGKGPLIEKNQDVLLESIVKARTIDQMKDIINLNYNSLEARYISQLFKTIYEMIRFSSETEKLKYELLSSKEFEILANKTVRVARHLESSEALDILVAIDKLGISSNTLLSQSILQMIRYWVNDYTIDEIYLLYGYLRTKNLEISKHTLMNALMLSLPHVLRHKISYKEMDFYNAKTLLKCLEMISFFGPDVYGDTDSIMKCFDFMLYKLDDLRPKKLLNLLSFIYAFETNDKKSIFVQKIRLVIDRCVEKLVETDNQNLLNELPSTYLVKVMMKIKNNSLYYNEKLFDLISKKTENFKTQSDYNNIFTVMKKLSDFKYVNYEMLRYLAKKIDSNDTDFWESKIIISDLFSFFTVPSDHQTIHNDFSLLASKILSRKKFYDEIKKNKIRALNFIRACLILNVQSGSDSIRNLLKENLSSALEISSIQSNRLILLNTIALIYQGLILNQDTEFSEANYRFIETKLRPYLDEYFVYNQNRPNQMEASLLFNQIYQIVSRKIDKNLIEKNILTKTSFKIHLKINLSDSQTIGIVLLTKKNFCRNQNILNGETKFWIDSLAKSEIRPCPIELEAFKNLSDPEKEIFLENLITKKPTLIQEKAIPLALEGSDILARARTGTGKTGAFCIPIIQKLLEFKKYTKENEISTLILGPSKDLCHQITKNFKDLIKFCKKEIMIIDICKGSFDDHRNFLMSEKPDIIISTPRIVMQFIQAKIFPKIEKSLKFLVIDESDLMFSFGYQNDLQEVLKSIPKIGVQHFLMSATLNVDVKELKKLFLHNPIILKLEEPDLPESDRLLQYHIEVVDDEEKFVLINALLKLGLIVGKSIIFVNKVDRCYQLKLFLEQFGIRTCVLNSELPIASRCYVIEQFNSNYCNIILASDEKCVFDPETTMKDKSSKKKKFESSVSRGIDFNYVSNVINFDFPTTIDSYVHRVGRTARGNEEAEGNVLSFILPNDRSCFDNILSRFGQRGRFKPYQFKMNELEAFRYRARDALRAVTTIAIRNARFKEIKREMLASKNLKSFFQHHPKDHVVLKLDRPLNVIRNKTHLANVPEYIVPKTLKTVVRSRKESRKIEQLALLRYEPKRKKTKRLQSTSKSIKTAMMATKTANRTKNQDPLKTFRMNAIKNYKAKKRAKKRSK
ncbi:ATP-dependent RNA helicase DDX56-like protein [Sarcoptes scabiei]|uniref:RNA helicase n=1 Tax=Sarcoptes scabiei TaxID=52283 RepID=A0A132A307_SARSC|nr:ATP-dependent RNA helicase DDX56-like protein [Sarcoptes scabiei]